MVLLKWTPLHVIERCIEIKDGNFSRMKTFLRKYIYFFIKKYICAHVYAKLWFNRQLVFYIASLCRDRWIISAKSCYAVAYRNVENIQASRDLISDPFFCIDAYIRIIPLRIDRSIETRRYDVYMWHLYPPATCILSSRCAEMQSRANGCLVQRQDRVGRWAKSSFFSRSNQSRDWHALARQFLQGLQKGKTN